jgi:hypothetical protein
MNVSAWVEMLLALLVLTYSTVGAVVASRRPGNPIGWIFCGTGLFVGFSFVATAYADYTQFVGAGPATTAEYLTWLSAQLAGPVIALATILLLLLFPSGRVPSGLLFPEGRRPSRSWWRAVVWMAVGGSAILALWLVSEPPPSGTSSPINNPLAIRGIAGDVLIDVGLLGIWFLLPISFLFAGAALISRLTMARGEERQQVKWFAYAAAIMIGGFVWTFSFGTSSDLLWHLGLLVGIVGFAFLPVATAIAILKYRLYDIDIIINRTLVYAYFVGVTVTQTVLQALTAQEELPQLVIVASTLVIAALFSPLRRGIQSFIDRRFYRRKYDAAKTLAAFNARLRDQTELDTLSGDVVGVVTEAMQPEHVSLWLRPDTASKGKPTE